jgi:predicted TIM-barrel fold metal-dependent hydrolase
VTATADGRPLYVVDADSHISEPHDLWTSRVAAKHRDIVPHVVRGADGLDTWYVNGDQELAPGGASSAIRPDGTKEPLREFDIRTGMQQDATHPAAFDVTARLEMLEHLGIWAQIVYPNVVGFGANKLVRLERSLSNEIVRVYNDAMGELQAASGLRLFPQALVPFWDVDAAVAEVARAGGELGLTGVVMCSEPHAGGLPDLLDPHWYPLWEACGDLGLPINFHVGASDFGLEAFLKGVWPSHDRDHSILVGASLMELHNGRILANLLASDLLDRFPKTRWVSVESGIGWIPFVIERLDWQIADLDVDGVRHTPPLELFRRQVYACFWFEKTAPTYSLEAIGFDNVLFETDFPHPTCLYPSPVEHGLKVLEAWGPEVQRKVMGQNAADLYGIVLPDAVSVA